MLPKRKPLIDRGHVANLPAQRFIKKRPSLSDSETDDEEEALTRDEDCEWLWKGDPICRGTKRFYQAAYRGSLLIQQV